MGTSQKDNIQLTKLHRTAPSPIILTVPLTCRTDSSSTSEPRDSPFTWMIGSFQIRESISAGEESEGLGGGTLEYPVTRRVMGKMRRVSCRSLSLRPNEPSWTSSQNGGKG